MKAKIWASRFVLPSGFCFNCGEPASVEVFVPNEGGLAAVSGHGYIGAVAVVARELVIGNGGCTAHYCALCAPQAKACVWEDMPRFLMGWKLRPKQTVVGRAFRILNGGKDILRGNKEFIQVLYTNPHVMQAIRLLNPDTRIT